MQGILTARTADSNRSAGMGAARVTPQRSSF